MKLTKPLYTTALMVLTLLVSGCGAYFNQPVGPQEARISENTGATEQLFDLPPPESPVVVGVYNFKDQTGQYKNVENGSTFSTAVTQGATTILIKALEDSKWFRPIERENFQNLLNERNIIRTTRQEYSNPNNPPQKLNPLLFAGILLEGGVISYDSNIMTGGVGARYFGVGGNTQYRQDRITVYLRAISTNSGEVLKTVNVSKTLLSQAVDVGVFRYVNFQRLLEIETGFTKNEPAQLAVQEAIETAVRLLILEGIDDELWGTKEGPDKDKELLDAYKEEKELEASTDLYERRFLANDRRHAFNVNFGLAFIDGDYNSSVLDFGAGLGYKYRIYPEFAVGYEAKIFKLHAQSDSDYWWLSQSVLFEYNILPHDRLSPILYAGPGVLMYADDTPTEYLTRWDAFINLKLGLGLEYNISDRFAMTLTADWNTAFTDQLDDIVQGRRDDYYYNFGLGFNYRFGTGDTRLKHKNGWR